MTWYQSVRDMRVWVSIDPEDVEAMRAAIEADRVACGDGVPCMDFPRHNTGYVVDNDRTYEAVTYRCFSLSRWFNPKTGQMEGHAHCTCDSCF